MTFQIETVEVNHTLLTTYTRRTGCPSSDSGGKSIISTLSDIHINDSTFRLHQGNGFGRAITDGIMTAA